VLAESIRVLLIVKNENQQRIETLLAGVKPLAGAIPLSSESIVSIVQSHLVGRNSSRLPVLVDPHWFRGSSYLKIGWSWVKQALHQGWDLISVVSFVTNIDPAPVKASRLQHQTKTYRIEFKATTYIWTN
jgi:hypothetical protein